MNKFRIKEFARKINRSTSTVRRWEREGLIEAKRMPSGHRYFDDSDVAKVLGFKIQKNNECFARYWYSLATAIMDLIECKGEKRFKKSVVKFRCNNKMDYSIECLGEYYSDGPHIYEHRMKYLHDADKTPIEKFKFDFAKDYTISQFISDGEDLNPKYLAQTMCYDADDYFHI